MNYLAYIFWNVSPEIFRIGPISIRWYGLLFASGFVIGYLIMTKIFRKEGRTQKELESLTMTMIVGTVIGARLGHCLFYDPIGYLSDPISILKVWEGGLASHGAAIGIIIALWYFAKKHKKIKLLWLFDRVVIVVALAGFLIRMGNLMNSEIIGTESVNPTSFIFVNPISGSIEKKLHNYNADVTFEDRMKDTIINKKTYAVIKIKVITDITGTSEDKIKDTIRIAVLNDPEYGKHIIPITGDIVSTIKEGKKEFNFNALAIPRHPAQLYEAITYLFIFLLLYYFYQKKMINPGFLFGIFLITVFGSRFFIEFVKDVQSDFERDLPLYMGQILSIPFVIAGIIFLVKSLKHQKIKKV